MSSGSSTSLVDRLRWIRDSVVDARRWEADYAIAPTDLVLDVGSGGSPCPRSNVLCDKFLEDGTERHGGELYSDGRPMIMGDVERLPFADGAFDYVICKHVLEHVADPALAASELSRVSRRGYVETPNASWEELAGFSFHRWRVSRQGQKLIFEPKHSDYAQKRREQWFGEFLDELGIAKKVWFERRRLGVYTELVWEGQIEVEVRGEPGHAPEDHVHAALEGDYSVDSKRSKLDSALQRYSRKSRAQSDHRSADIGSLVRCPKCTGGVSKSSESELTCSGCGSRYPIDDAGRWWLLVDRAI